MSGSKWTIRINPYLLYKKLISGSGRFGIFEDVVGYNKQVYHDNDEFKAKSTTREAPSDEDSDVNYDSEVAYIPPMFASLFLKHASYDA